MCLFWSLIGAIALHMAILATRVRFIPLWANIFRSAVNDRPFSYRLFLINRRGGDHERRVPASPFQRDEKSIGSGGTEGRILSAISCGALRSGWQH